MAPSPAIEPLEARRLLSAAVADVKSGALARLGQDLVEAYGVYEDSGSADGPVANLSTLLKRANRLLNTRGDSITIDATARTNGSALESGLLSIGATQVTRAGRNVSAVVPVRALPELAALPSLAFARPSYARLNAGSVDAQSDNAIRSINARSTYSVTGAGVKVGVLSDSFDTGPGSFGTDIGTGDLPGSVQILSDFAGGSDEGRAMAQLIYDSAPGATLAFATAFVSATDFANNIRLLRDAGCRVIVDDVIYLDEPFFQDGPIAQAVTDVAASGVAYFSSAGNQARQSYDSTWRNGLSRAQSSIPAAPGLSFLGGTTFDFDPSAGVDDMDSFLLAAGDSITVSLQWDQPFLSAGGAGSANDVDVYVLDAFGTQVLEASVTKNTGGDAVEIIQFTNTTGSSAVFNLMAVHYTPGGGPLPGRLKFVDYDGAATGWQYDMNAGTVSGHANSATGAGVAAARYDFTPAFGVNPPQAEFFSSYGNVPILFDTAGTRLVSAITRQQPRLTGVDGSDTTFFGQAYDATPAPNFFGTSASAPVVAAVAALMFQAAPSLTPSQLFTAMSNTALDMDDPGTVGFDSGFDFLTGYGLVRADNAIASLAGSISGEVFEDRNGNGTFDAGEPGLIGVTVYIDSNNSGLYDGGEITAVTAGAGTYTFGNLLPKTYTVREIIPETYVLTSPVGNIHSVTVPVTTAVSGKHFGNFPYIFTGTAGNDSYYVRASGGNAQIWVGAVPPTTPTYSIAKSMLPSLSFNAQAGDDTLVLDHSLGDPTPAGGIAFAGGAQTTTAGDVLDVRGAGLADVFSLVAAGIITHVGNSTSYSAAETLKLIAGTYNVSFDLAALNLETTGGTSKVNLTWSQNLASLTIGSGANVTSTSSNGAAPALIVTAVAVNSGTLMVSPSGNLSGVSRFKSLTITGTGAMDLRNNDLVVDYTGSGTPFTSILNYVKTGIPLLGFGGTGVGIASTEVQNQTISGTMVGVIDGATTGGLVSVVSGYILPNPQTSVLVKYTWRGDTNLTQSIDGSDYALADTGFTGGGTGWFYGDVNYDGVINGSDYALIDTGFSSQSTGF
ncbi:MAG: S8 family serine peptidase [Burkholderiales bacterium]|nr:S8 family serine peptidase [Phycisphaerae bacterium]